MFEWLNPYASPRIAADGPYRPQYALDELAAALHVVRGRPRPRRIVNSIKLRLQFPSDLGAKDWQRLERELDVVLPPLTHAGGISFPEGWETVFDVARYVAARRPEWEAPSDRSLTAWRNAQVFAGVRDCLARQLDLAPREIYREASFVRDLLLC